MRYADELRDESMVAFTMDIRWRQADTDARTPRDASASAASSDLRGKLGAAISSSVANGPWRCKSKVPEVTTKGRSEPMRASPSVSVASLSVSAAGP